MKKKGMLAALAAFVVLLALTIPAIAVSSESGFEDDDGNLAVNSDQLRLEQLCSDDLDGHGAVPNIGEDRESGGRSTVSRTPRPPRLTTASPAAPSRTTTVRR